jgi:hypothetical protein
MSKTQGVKVTLGDAEARGTKFANKAGFDPADAKLGNDTIPGPPVGAPLYQSRRVDDFDAKKTTYWAGNGPTPGLLNDLPKVGGGVGFEPYTSKSETADSPVRKQGREMPNPGTTSKAQEVRENDPTQGLGVTLDGVMKD